MLRYTHFDVYRVSTEHDKAIKLESNHKAPFEYVIRVNNLRNKIIKLLTYTSFIHAIMGVKYAQTLFRQ